MFRIHKDYRSIGRVSSTSSFFQSLNFELDFLENYWELRHETMSKRERQCRCKQWRTSCVVYDELVFDQVAATFVA